MSYETSVPHQINNFRAYVNTFNTQIEAIEAGSVCCKDACIWVKERPDITVDVWKYDGAGGVKGSINVCCKSGFFLMNMYYKINKGAIDCILFQESYSLVLICLFHKTQLLTQY